MTAQREQRGCCDIAGIRPQSYRFNNIRSRANTAADNQGNIVADAFVTQPLINGRQCQLYGNTDIITNSRGSGAGAAAESVNRDNIGAAPAIPLAIAAIL